MSEFLGSWKLSSVTGFDAYLKELGINVVLRKLAALTVPTVVFQKDSATDVWTMRTETLVKNVSCKFRLDEAFEETTIDDRKVECKFQLEQDPDKVLVQWQTDKQGRVSKISRSIRESDGTESEVLMDVKMEVNGVSSDAIFKLLK